jgi:flagellar hook-associated protein 3 FlgL
MGIRITQNIINQSMLRNVNQSYKGLSKLQDEISSGKRINRPSDDPFGASQSMGYQTKLSEIETFKGNANDAKDELTAVDDTISSASDLFNRVKELVVKASSDTNNMYDRGAIADEINSLKDQFGDIANTTFNGKYLFADPDSTTPPYQSGSLDQGALSTTTPQVEVAPGSTIEKGIAGNDLFVSNGTTIFDELDNIVADMKDPTKTGADISSDHLDTLDKQMKNFTTLQTVVGARSNRIDQALDRLGQKELSINQYLSDTEDVDVAKAMTDLSTQENVHKAALSVGARIIQPTLMDYLR